jgi:hypothetical protein
MRDDRERLLDIVEAIQLVEQYSIQGRDAFDHNRSFKFGMCTIFRLSAKLPVS